MSGIHSRLRAARICGWCAIEMQMQEQPQVLRLRRVMMPPCFAQDDKQEQTKEKAKATSGPRLRGAMMPPCFAQDDKQEQTKEKGKSNSWALGSAERRCT